MRTDRRTAADRPQAILTAALTLLAAACGGGSTGPDDGPVDATDTRRLVEFLAGTSTLWPGTEEGPTCPLGGDAPVLQGQRFGVEPDGSGSPVRPRGR